MRSMIATTEGGIGGLTTAYDNKGRCWHRQKLFPYITSDRDFHGMEMKKIPDPPQSIFSSEVIANKSKEPEIVLHHI